MRESGILLWGMSRLIVTERAGMLTFRFLFLSVFSFGFSFCRCYNNLTFFCVIVFVCVFVLFWFPCVCFCCCEAFFLLDMIFIVSRQVFTLNLSAFFFRGRFDGWLLFLRSYALKITKHPLPKPEQQVLTSPWCHHTLKLVFKPEKDEQIYLDALNSKSYFYETVREVFSLNSKIADVSWRVTDVSMTSFQP